MTMISEQRTMRPYRFVTMRQDHAGLHQIGHRRELAADCILAEPGQQPEICYFVEAGRIEASVINSQGTERILFFYEAGSLVLAQNVLLQERVGLGYRTVVPTVVRCMTREELLTAMQADFAVAMEIMDCICENGCSSERRLQEDIRFSAEGKVCDQLLEMAALFGKVTADGICIDMKLRQQTMASLLGLHRVTLVNIIKNLRSLGLVDYRAGQYCIHDLQGLQRYRDAHCLDAASE